MNARFRKLAQRLVFVLGIAAFLGAHAEAQFIPPGPELDLFKKDVGDWDCEIKTWASPGVEPAVTKGSESSRMLGGHWMITDFKGNMMGMDFEGHGNYGYDAKKKKYVGTWVDSMGPYMMHTEGTYDQETETLTVTGEGPGQEEGSMYIYTMATCYKGGKRVMTMYMQPKGTAADKKMKFFEITYKKKAAK